MRRIAVAVAVAVALALAAGPRGAWGQPAGAVTPPAVDPTTRAAAEEAFRVGAQAFRANRFAVAARAFEEAHARDPRPETAFSIAQANRLQYFFDRIPWRVQRAVQLYQWYLERLPAGPRVRDALDRLGELEPLLRELRERGELVPYAPPIRTQLVVGAEVDRAQVTIDGRTIALWEPVDVAAGRHTIVVEAPGYEREERRVIVAAGTFLPVDVSLVARPGRLVVRAEGGARLYVDGRAAGTLPGRPQQVAPGEHLVSVTRRGRRSWSRVVQVGRDQDVVVDAALTPTGQRRASYWVLGSAVALAAAGAGVETAAWLARREARALDRRRRDLTATPAELARYNQQVAIASTRRDLALGIGISAAAVALVGAGLWWFDREPPGDSSRLELQPIVGRTGAGVMLDLRF